MLNKQFDTAKEIYNKITIKNRMYHISTQLIKLAISMSNLKKQIYPIATEKRVLIPL
jgi:hypothetical protein